MPAVTATLEKLLREKDKKILAGQTALDAILRELRKQIIEELATTPGDSYSALVMRQHLVSFEGHLQRFEVSAGRELDALVATSWEGGADLLSETARVGGLGMTFGHTTGPVLQVFRDSAFYRIRGLSSAAFDRIRGELTLGILGQKTPHQVMTAIAGSLESPGVFKSIAERASVITRVEMGRAFSQATQLGMEQATASLPELKKQWWHAGHPRRPRASHLALHGQLQPVAKPFLVGSLSIEFPRSPKAPASEVINCGCEMVPWHPRWSAERLPLPIYNQRGEEIARRGPRTGSEEDLSGKFKIGEVGRRPQKS